MLFFESYEYNTRLRSANKHNLNKPWIWRHFMATKKTTRKTKKTTRKTNKKTNKDLEAKITELEGKLSKLSTQVAQKPA
ncbi:hypothetical protein LCGC14_2348170, partial [marine sediment metagenome]